MNIQHELLRVIDVALTQPDHLGDEEELATILLFDLRQTIVTTDEDGFKDFPSPDCVTNFEVHDVDDDDLPGEEVHDLISQLKDLRDLLTAPRNEKE